MNSPQTWLRKLGAVRPMAPVGSIELVLGEWCEGFYPIQYERGRSGEIWHLFGHEVDPLTEADCVRILKQITQRKDG